MQLDRPARLPAFESLDELQCWILAELMENGEECAPRGLPTTEILGMGFTLSNPRRRCLSNPARRWSLPLALGELCWHLGGSDLLSPLFYYANRWSKFSDNHYTLGSCYGKRIFSPGVDGSQWSKAISLLKADPDSRRVVLDLTDPELSLNSLSKDVPCASHMQFFVRSNRLELIVTMRSNDAYLGLPYDIFLFTMIQEIMACSLGIELGNYRHFVGSLHLYQHNRVGAAKFLASRSSPPFQMPRIDGLGSLSAFLTAEVKIRAGENPETEQLTPFWHDLTSVFQYEALRRQGRTEEASLLRARSPYRDVLN